MQDEHSSSHSLEKTPSIVLRETSALLANMANDLDRGQSTVEELQKLLSMRVRSPSPHVDLGVQSSGSIDKAACVHDAHDDDYVVGRGIIKNSREDNEACLPITNTPKRSTGTSNSEPSLGRRLLRKVSTIVLGGGPAVDDVLPYSPPSSVTPTARSNSKLSPLPSLGTSSPFPPSAQPPASTTASSGNPSLPGPLSQAAQPHLSSSPKHKFTAMFARSLNTTHASSLTREHRHSTGLTTDDSQMCSANARSMWEGPQRGSLSGDDWTTTAHRHSDPSGAGICSTQQRHSRTSIDAGGAHSNQSLRSISPVAPRTPHRMSSSALFAGSTDSTSRPSHATTARHSMSNLPAVSPNVWPCPKAAAHRAPASPLGVTHPLSAPRKAKTSTDLRSRLVGSSTAANQRMPAIPASQGAVVPQPRTRSFPSSSSTAFQLVWPDVGAKLSSSPVV